jgi:superfamily II RNA helicase
MTPANIFLLNRKLIEEYAKKIPLYFVTSDEIAQIHKIWNQKLHKYKKIYEQTKEWNDLFQLVLKGIGIHHSGMIPILKEIVEILYSQGLLKILLTTETFALGVNMPTKTTVFFDVTKFDGETSYRSLYPEEYNQMAGRAGRRGKDFIGYIVILPSYNFIPEYEAKQMIITKPQKIQSKLSLDTLFILKELSSMNTISTETINNLDKIINYISSKYNNSFYYYQDININNKLEYEFNKFKTNLDELINTSNINASIVEKYIKINNINKKLKPDGIIQLNNKIKKKYLNESKLLENEIKNYDIKLIENFIFYTNKLNELNTLLNIKNKTNEQFTLLLNFLQYNNYIDDNYIITKNGKIISEINECNPFLLLALIQHDNFNNLEFPEIVALVSLLINEYKSKDDIYITDLDCSLKCKEILTYITAYSNEYNKKENNLNNMLPYPCWLDWTINLSTFNCVKLWTENNSWSVITTKYNIFQGNFIKTILRVTNILKNIEIIANIFNNINLINKLDGYLEKIIRDIVITDSLYLN